MVIEKIKQILKLVKSGKKKISTKNPKRLIDQLTNPGMLYWTDTSLFMIDEKRSEKTISFPLKRQYKLKKESVEKEILELEELIELKKWLYHSILIL